MADILAVSKGDYAVVNSPDGKGSMLIKVSGSNGITVTGVATKYQNIQELRQVVDIPAQDVYLNLGPDPRKGKVYGVDVSNLYRGSVDHKRFGRLCWMYKPEDEAKESIIRGFNVAYKRLQNFGLEALASEDIVWELTAPNNEKYAGMYIPQKKTKSLEIPPRILIRPEVLTADQYPYVVLHELGHHVHSRYLKSPKLEAAWVKLYNTSIKKQDIRKEEAQQMLDNLLAGEDHPSAYKKSLEEEDALVFKWIMRHIKQTHNVSVYELDLLFKGEEREEIRYLWPTRTIERKELAPVISEYATKNFRETFAEAFAFHLMGLTLPKNVVKLVERTLSYTKAQFGASNDESESDGE